MQNDYKKSNVGREAYCGLQLEEGGERETTSVSDRWRNFVRSGFELVVEGLAYFRLTRIRNRPFGERSVRNGAELIWGTRGGPLWLQYRL